MLKRFFCSLRGHLLVHHRNIYGDENNHVPGRSVYRCTRCDYFAYGLELHPEKWQITESKTMIADLTERLMACRKLGPWMSAALSEGRVCKEMKEDAQAFIDAVTPDTHEWEQVGDPILRPEWHCSKCGARTNNAILLVANPECPGKHPVPVKRYALLDGEDTGELCCGEKFTLEEAKERCAKNGWKIDDVMENIIIVDTQ